MAKAETFGKQTINRDGTGTSLRDYTSLLGVVAAGILGISLLCITSAIALSGPQSTPIVLEPASIVDLAVNNINTVSALTVQALSTISIESTPILLPSRTPTASPSPTSRVFITFTPSQPTRTRPPRIPSTLTPKPPTNTSIPPSKTPIPSTNTSAPPSATNTLIPLPSDTNTPIPLPSDTNTPVPPDDTATTAPPDDTATTAPPDDTNTPGAVEPIINNTPTPGP